MGERRPRSPLGITLLMTAASLLAAPQRSPVDRPWPPAVESVSAVSPPLSPAKALQTFHMPPGYWVELVASEPLVQEPVAMDWDADGRLWVVEMPGYMASVTGANELDPVGRVVVLEDTDGDGQMDRRTIFAEHLVLARSIKVLDRGVLVAEPPNLWLMHDTDGDLRMDRRELVTAAFGRRDGDPQNNANGFAWGLDNSLLTAGQTDLQLRLTSRGLVVEHTLPRGEWGVSQDDAGRTYRNTNESALHVDLVPTAYYARNPSLLRTRGSYERLADEDPDLNVVWPVRPNPGTNRAYQVGIDRTDGTLARFTAVCAPLVYRGDRLPAELYGNVFVAEPAANVVSRMVLDEGRAGLRARKAYDRGEFLASTDERFRPVFLANAPDGTLYVADLYRGILEHRISITEYLRDQIVSRGLDSGTGFGRIYRVRHATTAPDLSRVATRSTAELVAMLAHANGWRRDVAQRLLVERRAIEAAVELKGLAAMATDWRTRVRALWTLDGLDAIDSASVERALDDPSTEVRVAAVRLTERWLPQPSHPVHAAFMKRLDDADVAVRRQVAATLGALPVDRRNGFAAAVLARGGDDPIVIDAVLSAVRGGETAVLDMLLTRTVPTNALDGAITMLAATIILGGQEAAVQRMFAIVADVGVPLWQRSALVRGAEVALLGAPMPGARQARPLPPVVAGPLPCPSCPGGRAGPGGAYAFDRPPNWNSARNAGPALRLTSRPAALVDAASPVDGLASRIASVLGRVTWPGKPGAVDAVPPLTPDEQRQFVAGREIYKDLCAGCHQPDGRGQETVAANLVGSAWLLAAPDVPLRILLNGKEGGIGLMPSVGASLDDTALAAVLTYVRREWGNTGTAISAAAAREARGRTAARTRPWTDAELQAAERP